MPVDEASLLFCTTAGRRVRRDRDDSEIASACAEIKALLRDYAKAWWDASPSGYRLCFADDARHVCYIGGNTLVNSLEDIGRFIFDRNPTPIDDRALRIEALNVEPYADVAGASIVIEGLEPFPVAEHLQLIRDSVGWRIIHVLGCPRP